MPVSGFWAHSGQSTSAARSSTALGLAAAAGRPKPHTKSGCALTQEDVLNASALHFGYCAGDVVRFQILSGRLWVDFRTEREATGWYPMKNGPGAPPLLNPQP